VDCRPGIEWENPLKSPWKLVTGRLELNLNHEMIIQGCKRR
jgi:hypothetical protein